MHSALLSCVTAMYGRLRRRRDGGGLWRAARQPQQPHHRCCHMPTDLTSKSRNHRQPEAFPHIPASWLLLCAEYKLLIFSLQKASLSCARSYSTAGCCYYFYDVELDSRTRKPCFLEQPEHFNAASALACMSHTAAAARPQYVELDLNKRLKSITEESLIT